MDTTRRDILKSGVAVAAGLALSASAASAGAAGPHLLTDVAPEAAQVPPTPPSVRRGEMLYRKLGDTGAEVSLIGMGGFHIGKQADERDSISLIHNAVDRGITFMDNSWDYNGGVSEIRMGKALHQGGYRDKVFLMTKIDGRTGKAATDQLHESLTRLQTDHLDLLQFHEILRMEDPDRVFMPGGALDVILEAKRQGKVRHIGFTGHKDPLVHRRMLEVADQHGFHFDTVQMPVNILDAHFRSFTHQVLPILAEKNIAPLAMKTFGDHFILSYALENQVATPIEMLHYSMTQPVAVVITGIDRPQILDQAMEAVKTFQPMSQAQMDALLARTTAAAATGRYEKFKTTTHFDSTAHNPEWLG